MTHPPTVQTSVRLSVFFLPPRTYLSVFAFVPVESDSEFFASCLAEQERSATVVVSPTTVFGDPDLAEKAEDVAPDSYLGAFSDFYGLPTNPICVYRTGDAWPARMGPGAQRILREARPVCNHPIRDVWPKLGEEIYIFFDSLQVKWSTIDVVRFAEEGGEAGPLHLWVGVIPKSLSLEGAKAAASGCKKILADARFPDIEIAFRESVFTRSAGPRLLDHVCSSDSTADVRIPLTPALGIRIAPRNTPHFEGTGALYLRESGRSDRVFLLTARHVVFPPPIHENRHYARKSPSQPNQDIIILGSKSYSDTLEIIMAKIGAENLAIEAYKARARTIGEATQGEDASVAHRRQELQENLAKAEETVDVLYNFHSDIARRWSTPGQRVLGRVLYAPPISIPTGPQQFTEDWALIELNRDKINWDEFKGNVVSLTCRRISEDDFTMKMHPHRKGRSSFKYPADGLLKVKGIVKEDEIRMPKQLDRNGEECLIVIKNGTTTGVTIGRMTGIESFVRDYYDDYSIKGTSTEIAVHSYSHSDGPFSSHGDSGSIVVDGQGRIVGLLTGGSGSTDSTDVTYLTPYFWLEKRIKQAFPGSFLYPIVD